MLDQQNIDKSIFQNEFEVQGLKIKKNQTSQIQSLLTNYILKFKKIKSVQQYDNDYNLILLKQGQKLEDLDQQIQKQIKENKIDTVIFKIKTDYEDFNMQQALQKLLPESFFQKNLIPSSFEQAGHIAHLNLFPCHQEYKYIIAQVLMDKNKNIKTVVNKVESLKDSIFRNPKLELIGGQDNYITNINEGNCTFKIDFSKVYWNSRLNQERDRMLSKLKKGQTLCDMFCGVGPLVIRAAKNGIKVFANDLNPDCYSYLKLNIEKNKVQTLVQPFNICAREFIRQNIKTNKFDHVYMNLPGTAIEFLDVFQEYLDQNEKDLNLPIIHIYTFLKEEQNFQEILIQKITEHLRYFNIKDLIEIYHVRDVSASSIMYSVSFKLNKNILNQGSKKVKLQ